MYLDHRDDKGGTKNNLYTNLKLVSKAGLFVHYNVGTHDICKYILGCISVNC